MQQGIKRGLAAVLSAVLTVSLLLNTLSIGVFAQDDPTALTEQIVAQLEQEGVEPGSGATEETPEVSAVPTQQPEVTEKPAATAWLEATETPEPSAVPEPSASAEPAETPAPTSTPMATESPVSSAAPVPTATAVPEQDSQQLTVEELKQQIKDLLEQSYSLTEMTEEELEESLDEINAIAAMPATMTAEDQADAELQELLDQLADAQAAMESMRMAWQAKREGWLDQLPQTGKENSWRYQNGTCIDKEDDVLDFDVPDGVSTFSAGGYWGIDVSHHQGVINWEAVKAAGIDFAIIRCGYGMNLTEQDDRQWSRNVSECERLGIPYGVYFYSYAMTADMAVEEGAHAVRLLEGHNPELPVFYDLEENSQLVLGSGGLAEIARIFCDIVGSKGYEVGVYASLNWWQYYLTDAVFENWYRWVAEWRSSCSYNGRYEAWQYTSKGTVDGINGNVDMNYWYDELWNTDALRVQVEEGSYTFHSKLDYEKVIDIAGGSSFSGGNAQIYAINGTTAQAFTIEAIENGYYKIRNVNSGKVLDVQGGSFASGTNVRQWDDNGTHAQQWCFVDAGDGYYYIQSRVNGLYLDVSGGNTNNGTNVQVYSLNATDSQKFRLEWIQSNVTIDAGIYAIQSKLDSTKVLDVSGASVQNGGNIQIYQKNGTAAQEFMIRAAGNGLYKIVNVNSGKLLDAQGAGQALGVNVQQWEDNGSTAQQWKLIDAGDGYVYIQCCANGLYLDVQNGLSANKTNVQLYSRNKSDAQKFRLVAPGSATMVESGTYTLHSKLNYEKVVDISGGSKANSGNVQLYSTNGSTAQTFTIESIGNGYYKIRNTNSGKVLDVAAGGVKSGTNVQQWADNGSNAQQWRFVSAGGGYYYIQSRCNGLYLDVSGGSTRNGANIQVYSLNKTDSQKFRLEWMQGNTTIENGVYTIQTKLSSEKMLDVSGGSKQNGGNIQIYQKNGTAAQKFMVESIGKDTYKIINVNSGKVLDAQGGSQVLGVNVRQWTDNGTKSQQWKFIDSGDGYFYIQCCVNGLYLDVKNGSFQNGANVQLYIRNKSDAQKFKLNYVKGE